MAEPGAGADDPRADRADDRLVTRRRGPRERRCDVHTLELATEARALRDRALEQAPPLQRANRVRERKRQRPALELDIGDPDLLSEPGAGGGQLAVERAAHDGHAAQAGRELVTLLRVDGRELRRRVGQLD